MTPTDLTDLRGSFYYTNKILVILVIRGVFLTPEDLGHFHESLLCQWILVILVIRGDYLTPEDLGDFRGSLLVNLRIRGVSTTLISAEEVAGVDFVLDVVEDGVVTVGDDGLRLRLEVFEVVDYFATKEGGAILKGGFVDDYICTLCLYALHDALDGTLTEVIGVRLHGEAEDADGGRFLNVES